MGYDFSKLNDREFEVLGASIIKKTLNKRIEVFKAGKDGGVDGRFWIGDKEGVIQCKHWVKTPYKKLISKLEKEEKKKVQILKPKRYIFITSQELSRDNKQEIKTLFSPYIKREDDIWGQNELDEFLQEKENLDVVEQHYKLWITSTNVLSTLLNSSITGRSKSTLEDIQKYTSKYAITDNHQAGQKILKKNNVVIISGDPGIGKTTLAVNLALEFLARGYEFCDIAEDISEAESLFHQQEKKKILFYYDDFLGANFYDAVSNSKDSHIVKFINRVKKDNTKKFILTSRTAILSKAEKQSHQFQNEHIRDNEFLLEVSNLSEIDKAWILYNHICHSNLEAEYINQIYEDKRYKEIIKHKNFNPRIIEFITDGKKARKHPPENYWGYVKKSLDDPSEIWCDYFQEEIDGFLRNLVFLTVFNGGRVNEVVLQKAYNKLIKLRPISSGDHSDKSFSAVIRLSIGSLLVRVKNDKTTYYRLFNPSIADFVLSKYGDDTELVIDTLKSLGTEESLSFIKSLNFSSEHKKMSYDQFSEIQTALFDYFYEDKIKSEDWDFLIQLSYLDFIGSKNDSRIKSFLEELLKSEAACGDNFSELITLLLEVEPAVEILDYEFLYEFVDRSLDEEEIKDLLNFIVKFDVEDERILSRAEELTQKYLNDSISVNDLDIDFNNYIHYEPSYSEDHPPDHEIDEAGIESEIYESIDCFLEDFNHSALAILNIDKASIVGELNPKKMAEEYLEAQNYEPDPDDFRERTSPTSFDSTENSFDPVDSIFER